MNLETSARILQEDSARQPGDELLLQVARRLPEDAQRVRAAGKDKRAGERTQESVLLLAIHAALEAVETAPGTQQAARLARAGLGAAGATEEQATGFLASLLAEEAFGYEDDPDQFDEPFVEESLRSLPALMRLDREAVAALRKRWVQQERSGAKLFDALAKLAWAEEPELVQGDHVRTLVDRFLDPGDRSRLSGLLNFLGEHGMIGPRRLARLLDLVPDAHHPTVH